MALIKNIFFSMFSIPTYEKNTNAINITDFSLQTFKEFMIENYVSFLIAALSITVIILLFKLFKNKRKG